MTWLRRWREAEPAPRPSEPDPEAEDSPAALREALARLVGFVNRSAGRLPGESVVAARAVGDTLREVIDTSNDRDLDIYAVVSVKAILNDYLPTTLRAYLALDPDTTGVPRPSGRTPEQSLLEQLDSLRSAARDVLVATQKQDADALLTQGSFLRTKFSRSDLEL